MVKILGIETSCDDTSCGLIEGWRVLAVRSHTQVEHVRFGGVVPEIASREHLRRLPGVLAVVLAEAGLAVEDLDAIAFTRGPGLAGPLLVGSSFARALALETGIPVHGVSHLEGHLAAVRLSHDDLPDAFLCLTVSGGHTELTEVTADGRFVPLGETRDDAAGEAFDKCGKILGLGYPAGPVIGQLAAQGDRKAFAFPRAMRHEETFDFSFSGLKTAVARVVAELGPERVAERLPDLCASLEEAIVDALVGKSLQALEARGLPGIAVCGGVSANRRLRERMTQAAARKGAFARFPEASLCTDNGAMIAGAALWRLSRGHGASLRHEVEPRLGWE